LHDVASRFVHRQQWRPGRGLRAAGIAGYISPVENRFLVPGVNDIPALPLGESPYHIDE
jgi:hypothetical protein